MKTHYLPADDAGKDVWLTNFAAKFSNYALALGFTAADVTAAQADAAYNHWCFISAGQVAAYAQQWTAYKNAARNGDGTSLGVFPIPPSLGTPPTAVAPNIFGRATALVARIKVSPTYTEAIGQALQIIGADHPVDPTTLKPVLTAALDAGQVDVSWLKQGMDALELWVDRGDGKGFLFLAMDSIPDYTDTAAMSPAGQSALWKYKGIYIQADQRVGQWSDVLSLPVAG
jgi:hypothetical protein